MKDRYIIQNTLGFSFESYDEEEGVIKWNSIRRARWFKSLKDAEELREKIDDGEIIEISFTQITF